jgi:hypothetical protein
MSARDPEANRQAVRRYRERYGTDYESKGRNRAARRAVRMFKEEHPDVWQRLLDEECGEFRALAVARRVAPAAQGTGEPA